MPSLPGRKKFGIGSRTVGATGSSAIDWAKLGRELGTVLSAELKGLIDGATDADTQRYAQAIGESMARNLAAGRHEMTDELKGQIKALGAIHSIKANDFGWEIIGQFMRIAMGAVKVLLGSLTGGAGLLAEAPPVSPAEKDEEIEA